MPIGDVVFLSPCSHPLNLFIPAAADHERPQLGHFFGVGFQPEFTVPDEWGLLWECPLVPQFDRYDPRSKPRHRSQR